MFKEDSAHMESLYALAQSRYRVVRSGLGWTIHISSSNWNNGWFFFKSSAECLAATLRTEFMNGGYLQSIILERNFSFTSKYNEE